MTAYRLGNATVQHGDGFTVTQLPDGDVSAAWAVQHGQDATAQEYGLPAELMNAQHDLAHSILAAVLGLPHSPTLGALASGRRWPAWSVEERAVLAVQGFAHAAGVDLERVARRLSDEAASQRG